MKEVYKKTLKTMAVAILWAFSAIVCAVLIFVGTFYYYTDSPLGFVKFFRTLHIVETQYAGSIDKSALLDGALEGVLAKLNDRHSVYLDGDNYTSFANQTSATYGGIGLYIGHHEDEAIVDDVIKDEPADQAGIKRGDLIEAIDGNSVKGTELSEVAKLIRGQAGTSVSITLNRNGESYTVDVERKKIRLQTVVGQIIPGTNIGYIRIAIFSENTGKEFTDLYNSLREQGMNKMILDLRNNPGGLLDQAQAVSSNFLPENSVMTSYVNRDGEDTEYTVTGTAELIPIVAIVNENTASAAEIIAGDIQDYELGSIVGVKSYGKGTVQGIYAIDSGDAVKLTVAKYKTGKGRIIDGTGIQPDVIVPLKPNDDVDLQFAKAFELSNQ